MTSHPIAAVTRLASRGMLFALVCALVSGLVAGAEAATIAVTTFDQVSGPLCTLTNAIYSANADFNIGACERVGAIGPDTIVLPTGTYALTFPDNGVDADLTALPVVTSDITILGNGSTIARTNGTIAPYFRIFAVTQGTLTLVELTVSGGLIRSSGSPASGGGIKGAGSGSLTLNAVTISGNSVDVSGNPNGFGRGGGISFQSSGTLALTDSDVVGNAVNANGAIGGGFGVAFGGGIFFEASEASPDVTFTRGSVRNNVASADAGGLTLGWSARGGGISAAGGLVLSSVAVSGNTASAIGAEATAFGGGVSYERSGPGNLTVSDSTFSGNTARSGGSAGGGGLAVGNLVADLDPASVQRSAFFSNTAQADGTGPTTNGGIASGGAISYQQGPIGGHLGLRGVTVVSNSATARPGPGGVGGAASGGAIAFDGELLMVRSVTLTGNSVDAPGGTTQGGGITSTGAGTVQNSIIIGNSGPADCVSSGAGAFFTSLGHNINPSSGSCGTPVATDKPEVDPLLGAQVDLGRPGGQYLPLQPTSPAIDGANPGACLATDQLGQSRVGACDIGAVEAVPVTVAVAAILPSTRAGVLGAKLTAFVSVINTSGTTAFKVGIGLTTAIPALFFYRTTDAQNVPNGTLNTPVDIAPGGVQTYVIAVTPTGPFAPTDLVFDFKGTNTAPVTVIVGLNTLLVSASVTPIPDLVALNATLGNNGIVDIPSNTRIGVFTMATVNLGSGDQITVTADTGTAVVPLTVLVCQTNAVGGCLAPAASSVTTQINAGATRTFGFFPVSTGFIPFDPAGIRIFARLKDSGGATRGGSSVAARSVP